MLLSACGGAAAPPPASGPPSVQVRAISTGETPTPSATASAAATATVVSSASPSSAPAIKLGLMAPFSGLAAAFGQEMLKGGQMALDEANGAGGVNGRRVLFDQADDKGGGADAPAAARKLVDDGVAAVIGPATSASALAAEGALNGAKLPLVTPTANDPRITDQGLPYVFRATGRWDQEPPLLAPVLAKHGKVALVEDGSDYGQALAAAMRQALAKAGVQVVADERVEVGGSPSGSGGSSVGSSPSGSSAASPSGSAGQSAGATETAAGAAAAGPGGAPGASRQAPRQSPDFRPVVAKVKAAAPRAVFYAGFAADGGALAKALRAAGVQASIAMGDAAEDQALITAAGSTAEGLTFAYPPDPKGIPAALALMDAYKRRYGTAASLYVLSTYDSVRLVLDALKRAGSTDGEDVRKAIAASDVQGSYWGRMRFDAKGDLQGRTYALWTVKAGKFEETPTST